MVKEAIRRDDYDNVLFCTHFVDNAEATRSNYKFEKVRPIFELMYNTSKCYLPRSEKVSIDEMMIPYFGRKGEKQFMKGKPIREGYKVWALCDYKGHTVHCEPYCGESTQLETFNMGQGPDVVVGLVKDSGLLEGTKIYFNNLTTKL